MRVFVRDGAGRVREARSLEQYLEGLTAKPAMIARGDVDGVEVETIFLGVLTDDGPPGLFVTWASEGGHSDWQKWAMQEAEARRNHKTLIDALRREARRLAA